MLSLKTKKDDYNHVLNSLQDYMLTGKTLAKTLYQQTTENDTDLKQKVKPEKPSQLVLQKKEPERFFFPNEKDQLFWCFYIIKYGFEKYEYPGVTTFINEKAEKFKCIEHLRINKQQLKNKNIRQIFTALNITKRDCLMNS